MAHVAIAITKHSYSSYIHGVLICAGGGYGLPLAAICDANFYSIRAVGKSVFCNGVKTQSLSFECSRLRGIIKYREDSGLYFKIK